MTASDQASELLDIGEVTRRSGLPTSTLHVWERHSLIRPVSRNGLRRQYDADVMDTIAIIVLCQRSGFTLSEIAGLLSPDAFAAGKAMLEDKLGELKDRAAALDAAISSLEHALECSEPSPLDCARFRAQLPAVLPVSGTPSPHPPGPKAPDDQT